MVVSPILLERKTHLTGDFRRTLVRHSIPSSMIISSGVYGLRISCLWRPCLPIEPLLQTCQPPFPATRRRWRRFPATRCFVSSSNTKQKIIVISGPTGAGKSRLALELAKRLNGEIISADSVQVYRGLDVGSAKPSISDRKEVPHHLVDILHPSEEYSVGKFYEDARQVTKDIISRDRVPIVSGGTGLYLRWYIYGKPDVPKSSNEVASQAYLELADLQKSGNWEAAVEMVVKAGDPNAKLLASNDWYRLRRSMEIIKSSGAPPSAFQVPYNSFKQKVDSSVKDGGHEVKSTAVLEEIKSKDLDYDFLCFFLSTPRVDLYRSIDFRCEDMLLGDNGLLSEAKWLLDSGLQPNSNSATRAIGYRQAMEYLSWCRQQGGNGSPGDFFSFLSEFQKASRNFAKRQLTWFRNEDIYQWLDASKPLEQVLNFIYDAYNDQSGNLIVPESLTIDKEMTSQREVKLLKAYRPKNRHFMSRQDCSEILEWTRTTQGQEQKELIDADSSPS